MGNISLDSLDKMFEEAKSAYSKNPDNSFGMLNSYIFSLKQYFIDNGTELKKLTDLLSFLLEHPECFPKINEPLISLLHEYENAWPQLEKSNSNLPEKAAASGKAGACYQRMGKAHLAEKYYKR